jgi:hypothetical protein
VIRRAFLPALPLAAFIAAFGAAALGASPLAFDDHPGQLYRVWLVVTGGPAPWRWHDGWWAGYPELQFYPPGFAYLGAALHALTLGALGVDRAYHVVVWLAWATPGATSYLLLHRVLGHGLAALPGAFVALTFSTAIASGVEGGVHIGMIAARLGWAMLPLLVWLLVRDSRRIARPSVIALTAALVLMHPAHLPTAVAAIVLAAFAGARSVSRGLRDTLLTLVGAAALTAFWSVPLVARLAETRALAWGTLGELLALMVRQPLALILVALAAVSPFIARTSAERLVARLPWIASGIVALDALVLEPAGLRWLPSDRVVDGAVLGIVLAAGTTIGRAIGAASARVRLPHVGGAVAALALLVALSWPGDTLMLWPRRAAWPTLEATERGLRLSELWARLAATPEGRVLFTRSGVPLVYGREWWRPHTHVTALTPRATGHGIVHGTFTHPSPTAALVYRGDAGRGAITALAERSDGRSLFGRPLAALDDAGLDRYTNTLGVSAIVAVDEDAPALRALDEHANFRRIAAPSPFVLWARREPIAIPRRAQDGWRITLRGVPGQWTTTRMTYYPLWRAFDGVAALETRRGELGDLEVRLARDAATVDLRYAAGGAERTGTAISAVALLGWAAAVVAAVRRPRPAQPASA